MPYDSFSAPGIGLPQELFAPFFDAGTAVEYRKGQMIYLQGQPADYMYCLKEGTVRTVIFSDQGEEKLLTVYRSGAIFGEASFFDEMPRVSSATAQTDCTVIPLSRGAVNELFQTHPELATLMIRYLARTVRLLSGHVDTMSFQQTNTRLAGLLLNHPSAREGIRVTHEELAAALNVSRVTVSRLLSDFSKRGLVKTGYGIVTLLNPEGLQSI